MISGGGFEDQSMPSGRVTRDQHQSSVLVDLVSEKEEQVSDSSEDVTSSSGQSSEEEFQEEQREPKLYLPLQPPAGYVFWQHIQS